MIDLVSHIPRYAALEAVALQLAGGAQLELPAIDGTFDQATIEISFVPARETARAVLLEPAEGEADGQPRIELFTRDDGSGAVRFGVGGFGDAELPLADGKRFEAGVWYQLTIYYDRGDDDAKGSSRAIVSNVMTEKHQWKKGAPPLVFPRLRIGGGDAPFEGAVNDIRVWRGLFAPELVLAASRTVFRRPATFGSATLAASWPLTEGFGDVAFEYAGGNRHARLTGEPRPAWVVSSYDVAPIYIIDILDDAGPAAESGVTLQQPRTAGNTRLSM